MESSRPRASSLSSNSSSSTSARKTSRPLHHKRVSFDATSVPLPSATWEELASPSTLENPPFPLPILGSSEPVRDIRKVDIDTSIDLKAVLARGIIEWRNEVNAEQQS